MVRSICSFANSFVGVDIAVCGLEAEMGVGGVEGEEGEEEAADAVAVAIADAKTFNAGVIR